MSKKPRASDPQNLEVHRYDEELRRTPPIVIWQLVPHSGGLRVAVYVRDPVGISDRRPRTVCGCNLFGRPKRQYGPHHDEECERWVDVA